MPIADLILYCIQKEKDFRFCRKNTVCNSLKLQQNDPDFEKSLILILSDCFSTHSLKKGTLRQTQGSNNFPPKAL